MKKIIPFTKTIKFKTMIAEITDIEAKHNLEVKEGNTIEGDILLDGKYKMHEASQIEEEFHYNLPFTIEVDNKYDISNCTITIDDFYFEIINEEDLKINIELEIGNVEEKPLPKEDISLDEEDIRKTVEKIPIADAFDELDTERDYYQARRKESNERLISRKGMIGRAIGFAPMVTIFVGYLIIPLVFIGFTSMNSSMNSMQTSY